MYNYKSPIETTMLQVKSDIEKRLEDTAYKAVIECGVVVDKDELIKALAYDRGQYEKGYGDGYRAAKDEIVRCKDCIYSRPLDMEDDYEAFFGEDSVWCTHRDSAEYGLGFCSLGERDENEKI